MDEVPVDIIEDRIAKKINKKKAKMESELKKAFGIELDDPKFNILDYEVPEPRPRKLNRNEPDIFRQVHPMAGPMMGMGPPGMLPPPPMFGLPHGMHGIARPPMRPPPGYLIPMTGRPPLMPMGGGPRMPHPNVQSPSAEGAPTDGDSITTK